MPSSGGGGMGEVRPIVRGSVLASETSSVPLESPASEDGLYPDGFEVRGQSLWLLTPGPARLAGRTFSPALFGQFARDAQISTRRANDCAGGPQTDRTADTASAGSGRLPCVIVGTLCC